MVSLIATQGAATCSPARKSTQMRTSAWWTEGENPVAMCSLCSCCRDRDSIREIIWNEDLEPWTLGSSLQFLAWSRKKRWISDWFRTAKLRTWWFGASGQPGHKSFIWWLKAIVSLSKIPKTDGKSPILRQTYIFVAAKILFWVYDDSRTKVKAKTRKRSIASVASKAVNRRTHHSPIYALCWNISCCLWIGSLAL